MTQKGKENIAIVNAGIFTFVGIMHLLRIIFNVDLIIGNANIALWMSVIGVLGPAFLVYYNIKSIENRTRAVWLKFILTIFVLDAFVVFYSWFANLSYLGFTKTIFGLAFIFDLIVIIILIYYINRYKPVSV